MLRSKIKILEERTSPDFNSIRAGSVHQPKSSDTMYSQNSERLVVKVQEKVTQFVMKRVEQQLELLENVSIQQSPIQQTHLETNLPQQQTSHVTNSVTNMSLNFTNLSYQTGNISSTELPMNGFNRSNMPWRVGEFIYCRIMGAESAGR